LEALKRFIVKIVNRVVLVCVPVGCLQACVQAADAAKPNIIYLYRGIVTWQKH
jgi:hypothetical protein